MKKALAVIITLELGSLAFWQAYSNANARVAAERAFERGRQLGKMEVASRLFQQGVEIPGDVGDFSIRSYRNDYQNLANERELWNEGLLYIPAWGLAGVSIAGLLSLLLSGQKGAEAAASPVKAEDIQNTIPVVDETNMLEADMATPRKPFD